MINSEQDMTFVPLTYQLEVLLCDPEAIIKCLVTAAIRNVTTPSIRMLVGHVASSKKATERPLE